MTYEPQPAPPPNEAEEDVDSDPVQDETPEQDEETPDA